MTARAVVIGSSSRTVAVGAAGRLSVALNPATRRSLTPDGSHSTSALLVGPASSVAGVSRRMRAHASTAALVGSSSVVAGTAVRARAHASIGALLASGSSIAGTAARIRIHTSVGSLAGQTASISGASSRAAAGTTLSPLTLSASSVIENASDGTFIGNFVGKTAGSTLTATYTAGGRARIGGSGESLTLIAGGGSHHVVTPTFDFTVKQSLSGYADQYTTFAITVTNDASYSATPLWLYDSSVSETDFNFIHGTDPDAFVPGSITLVDDIDGTGDYTIEMPAAERIYFTSGGTYTVVGNSNGTSGDVVTGASSGAYARVSAVVLTSGSWAGGDAAGYLKVGNRYGTFTGTENLNVGANLNVASFASWSKVDENVNETIYRFRVPFNDTASVIDLHMDQEYLSSANALVMANLVGPRLGKLPKLYRENIRHMQIVKGDGTFSAESAGHFFKGYEDRIYTRIASDDFEESCFHEGTHVAIQEVGYGMGMDLDGSAEWLAAVASDGQFITKYASTANQEDFAESALFAWTLHQYPERFPEPDRTQIANFTPARHAFWRTVFWPRLELANDTDGLLLADGTSRFLKSKP